VARPPGNVLDGWLVILICGQAFIDD
jgi:hypothetical protein